MTSWQAFKPLWRGAVSEQLLPRGFKNPGVTMWRHVGPLVHVVHARSRYGEDVSVWVGCSARGRNPHPQVWNCIFMANAFCGYASKLPIEGLVQEAASALVPLVDLWISRLSTIEAALGLAEKPTQDFAFFGAGSVRQREAILALQDAAKRQYRT